MGDGSGAHGTIQVDAGNAAKSNDDPDSLCNGVVAAVAEAGDVTSLSAPCDASPGAASRDPSLKRSFTVKSHDVNFKGRVYSDILEEEEAEKRRREEDQTEMELLRSAACTTAVELSRDQVAADASGLIRSTRSVAAALQHVGRCGARGGSTGLPTRCPLVLTVCQYCRLLCVVPVCRLACTSCWRARAGASACAEGDEDKTGVLAGPTPRGCPESTPSPAPSTHSRPRCHAL